MPTPLTFFAGTPIFTTNLVVLISHGLNCNDPMKLSRRSDYALRALFSLADRYRQGPLSIRELAEHNDIPRRFLEQIMLDLKGKGWVRSLAGRDGGFELAVSPEELTMGQVVRLFDGVLSPIGCVSVTDYEACTQESHCRFRRVLLEIRNFTSHLMEKATLARVMRGEPVRRDEVFQAAFIAGDGI
ncbi:MAG: Rrf2 family transcriptional regulator [Pirellulales bacterium]